MTVRRLEQRPSLGRLYAKAAITARGRRGDRLPDLSYELPAVVVERNNLAGYADVCGFRQSDVLPPTYPHILGFPAAVLLMVDPAFPFALPGLVHVNNRIRQTRPLRADERLTVCVHAADLRDHPRGRQFDMMTEVTIAGEPVWNEVSTYLRREQSQSQSPSPSSKSPSPSGSRSPSPSPSSKSPSPFGGGPGPPAHASRAERAMRAFEALGGGLRPTAIWRIPRDIGRRYAAVSGDVNPIHLNPLVARLFGFPRAIAHGMWLKAHCLAALEGRLPDALTAEVEFKSPLLLPSTVAFRAQSIQEAWQIDVAQARTGRPHLTGRVHVEP